MVDGQLCRIQYLIDVWLKIFIIVIFEVFFSSHSIRLRNSVRIALFTEKDKVISAAFCSDEAIVLHVMDIVVAFYCTWATGNLKAWSTNVGFHEPGAFVASSESAINCSVSIGG